MDVAALHQAEHLPREPAHLERLAVEDAGERVQRPHDVRDRPVAVAVRVGRRRALGAREHAGIRLAHHLLAVVHADEVVLKDAVVEHVLGGRTTPKAMFCAYTAHVAWLSPQMPQIRLVIWCASRGSLPFMKTL